MTAPVPISQLANVAQPDQIGQATAVEQARAVAEVAAAVQVARQNPRNIDDARAALQASCAMPQLAQAAFYSYTRAGSKVEGASADLARELARCWGNFQSGTDELRRDDDRGFSEMKAWAWDLESNARRSITFIVPHTRDNGAKITTPGDIYLNNQNAAARREREMILSTLPAWFVEEGEAHCKRTLKNGEGEIGEQRDQAEVAFARLGVTTERIERKLGTSKDRWTVFDVAHLRQVHKAVSRGFVSVDDEFPPVAVTVGSITASRPAQSRKAAGRKDAAPAQDDAPPPPPSEPYAVDDDGRPFEAGE